MDRPPAEKPPPGSRSVRSYVRRQGRITPAQKDALRRHWSEYGLTVDTGVIRPEQVFRRAAPLVLEIGFGMGDSLLAMARRRPDIDFIGIEVFEPGIGRLLNEAHKAGIENLRVFRDDAVVVLEKTLPPQACNQIQVLFPDPWPKKRHHKRRLITNEFAMLVVERLKPGGTFIVYTDDTAYAETIVDAATTSSLLPAKGPFLAPGSTKYEERARKLKRTVAKLTFVRS